MRGPVYVMAAAPITIALNKGRIVADSLPILGAAGMAPLQPFSDGRRLIFDSAMAGVRFVIVRSDDVPVYVERGAADIGITGKDTLLEHAGDGYYEWLDLNICRARLMTAGAAAGVPATGRLRVATKYPNSARRFYAAQARQVDVIHLHGAMELAPLLGLADVIVDIVETGNTLRANGLVAYDLIAEISSRVIVNRAAMKLRPERLQRILDALGAAAPRRAA